MQLTSETLEPLPTPPYLRHRRDHLAHCGRRKRQNGEKRSEDYDDPIERKPRKGLSVCNAKRPT